MRLGLCDPVVCNRYLLWGFFGAGQSFVNLAVIPQYYEYEHGGAFSSTWDVVLAAGEIFSLAMILLIFFSPAFYQRWIRGSAAAVEATEG